MSGSDGSYETILGVVRVCAGASTTADATTCPTVGAGVAAGAAIGAAPCVEVSAGAGAETSAEESAGAGAETRAETGCRKRVAWLLRAPIDATFVLVERNGACFGAFSVFSLIGAFAEAGR